MNRIQPLKSNAYGIVLLLVCGAAVLGYLVLSKLLGGDEFEEENSAGEE